MIIIFMFFAYSWAFRNLNFACLINSIQVVCQSFESRITAYIKIDLKPIRFLINGTITLIYTVKNNL
jgi:hypothetical protein